MKRTNQEVDELLKESKEYIRDVFISKIKITDDLRRRSFEKTKDNINKYVPDLINTNWENKQETRGGKRENSGAKPKGNVQYQRRIKPELVHMMDEYLNKLKNGSNTQH